MRIVKVDQKIQKRAVKSYVLADSSKIGKRAFTTNGYVYQVNALITDDGITSEQKKSFEEMDANIIIANI